MDRRSLGAKQQRIKEELDIFKHKQLMDEETFVKKFGAKNMSEEVKIQMAKLVDNNAGVKADALTVLTRLLHKKVPEVRERIISILAYSVTEIDPLVSDTAVNGLVKAGESAIQYIVPLLDNERWMTRSAALKALGGIGAGSAIPKILPLLHDKDEFVQMGAAEAIRHIAEKDKRAALAAVPTLRNVMLNHSSSPFRVYADMALAKLIEKDELEDLRERQKGTTDD